MWFICVCVCFTVSDMCFGFVVPCLTFCAIGLFPVVRCSLFVTFRLFVCECTGFQSMCVLLFDYSLLDILCSLSGPAHCLFCCL